MKLGAIPILYFGKIVRVVAGSWVAGQERKETLELVAEGLRGCLDEAEAHGVVLALEDRPVIGTAPRDFLCILELVGDERLKVNLDTSNPIESGASVLDLLSEVALRVVHVHASDRAEDLSHVVTGTGVVPLAEVFAYLRSVGFAGYISMEIGDHPNGHRWRPRPPTCGTCGPRQSDG